MVDRNLIVRFRRPLSSHTIGPKQRPVTCVPETVRVDPALIEHGAPPSLGGGGIEIRGTGTPLGSEVGRALGPAKGLPGFAGGGGLHESLPGEEIESAIQIAPIPGLDGQSVTLRSTVGSPR